MATIVAHAIQIESDNGNGDIVAFTNPILGFQDGVAHLITGRHGLDGSKTIAGDTTRTVWYEGILTKDFSSFSPSRNTDFIEGGGMSTASTLSFSIVEKNNFRAALRTAGIHLNRCRVKYFYVESADGVTFTFTQRWEGVIDDLPFSETRNAIHCIDSSKDIFGSLPTDSVDDTNFPNAVKDSLGKAIPIAFGRVAYSPLINVNSSGAYTSLTDIAGTPGITCAAKDRNAEARWVDLFTEGEIFPADSSELVGRFWTVVSGGEDQSIKITSNDATAAASETTRVYLEDAWTGAMVLWTADGTETTVWYFQVRQRSADFISTTKQASAFALNSQGQTALYSYDSSLKRFNDISELKTISSLSNIGSYGFPGLTAILRRFELDGAIFAYTPIRPSEVIFVENEFFGTWTGPAEGLSQPSLFDDSQSSGYVYEDAAGTVNSLIFDVTFPVSQADKTYDAIYLLVDLRHRSPTGGPSEANLNILAYGKDLHGRVTGVIFDTANIYDTPTNDANLGADWVDVFTLPGAYYNTTINPDKFFTKKALLDVSGIVNSAVQSSVYPTIRMNIQVGHIFSADYEMEIFEIGFVGQKSVSLISDAIYHSLIGETFGTEWRSPDAPSTSRRTAAAAIDQVGEALEHLIRNYDYNHPVWQAGKAYKVGERVRNTVDNGFIYICTVAGTTGKSTAITGAANNGSGLIRITSVAHGLATGNGVSITGVLGTAEANGNWTVTVISADAYDLQGSAFVNAYTSGGTVVVNFPTTLGNTVTDGTITWKALDILKIDCASFDALRTKRPGWLIGHTLTEKKQSIEYYKELARHGFFGILIDAKGRFSVKAWRENTAALATFDASTILQGTLREMTFSPMRRCYNDFLIRYDLNPATGAFNKQLFITHADEPEFPGISEALDAGTPIGFTTIGSLYTEHESSWEYQFLITTPSDHGLKAGEFVSLSGNADGFDFGNRDILSVPSTTTFRVGGHLTLSGSSSSGTLRLQANSGLKWKTFVGGISNYPLSKQLWDQCRASYVVTKSIQKLPQELGDLPFFFDPGALDPSGNRIWADLSDGDEHPAAFYLQEMVEWVTWQKKQITFEAANNSAYRALKLMDPVHFNDAKLTGGSSLLGWIHEVTDLPGDDRQPNRIRFGVTLNPEELSGINIIDENGADAGDIIDENGAVSTDIIDENGA